MDKVKSKDPVSFCVSSKCSTSCLFFLICAPNTPLSKVRWLWLAMWVYFWALYSIPQLFCVNIELVLLQRLHS